MVKTHQMGSHRVTVQLLFGSIYYAVWQEFNVFNFIFVFFGHFFELFLGVFWEAVHSLIKVVSTHLDLERDDVSFIPSFDMSTIVSLSNSVDGIWVRSMLHSENLFLTNTALLL